MADVNDKGEVTVEGELIGRLEGFRFRQDKTASPDEAKTLRQASHRGLVPLFHLRADTFYNAPDTEFEFTEQGGLMWGTSAVGKLVRSDDAMRPTVEAFVDDEAGHDVAEKVRRRLQHFMDRKIAALFEPLLNMSRDETLSGLARGVAFQLVEAMGVIPRAQIAQRHQGAGSGCARHAAQAWRALRAVHHLPAAAAETRADPVAAGVAVAA